MARRDDIADRARDGDVEGVLKIYDDVEADRQQVREVRDAYLQKLRELASGKPDVVAPPSKGGKPDPLAACTAALREATAARRGMTATIGAP